eukprot:scaffold6500_cov109-Isochrysis_galbana.AAC.4
MAAAMAGHRPLAQWEMHADSIGASMCRAHVYLPSSRTTVRRLGCDFSRQRGLELLLSIKQH